MNLVPCHLYHLYMVFAFFAVLITYFGVNFFYWEECTVMRERVYL